MISGKEKWLVERGYGGLYCPSVPCGCEISDLAPCGVKGIPIECKPGYKHMDPRPDHKGQWVIYEKKEAPEENEWEHLNEY